MTSFSTETDFRTSIKYKVLLCLLKEEKEKVFSIGEDNFRQIIPLSGPCCFFACLSFSLFIFGGASLDVNNVKVSATTGTTTKQPKIQQRRGAPDTWNSI